MGGIKGLRTARGLKNLGLGGNFVKGGGARSVPHYMPWTNYQNDFNDFKTYC